MSIFNRALGLESTAELQSVFNKLVKALRANDAGVKVAEGFKSKEISELKHSVSDIPQVVIDLFKCGIIDQSIYKGFSMFESTKIIISEIKLMGELEDEPNHVVPDPGVKKHWYHAKWFPFAGNGGGDTICVDMDPDHGGTRGQIILVLHDDPKRRLLAPSMAAFLEICLELAEK